MIIKKERPRILINAFSAKVGGGKTYINNLLARLPKGDYKIYLFLPDDFIVPKDCRLTVLKTKWPTRNPIARFIWEKLFLPGTLLKLDIDILFCPGGMVNTPTMKNRKTVTMFRNMLPFDYRISFSSATFIEKIINILKKKAMLRSMIKADFVIFISNFARKVIEDQTPIKNAVTIQHGISEQFFVIDKKCERPALPFEGAYILYVSRFEFYKKHLELVQAYQKLPKYLQVQYKLLLVGGTDLPAGQKVLQYVKEHKLQDFVFFLGEYPYSDLPGLYKNASLFVFASACENCPNILLEAMGAGVPILCSNYEPMPEFGGRAVTYMNPDSPEDISRHIEICLNEKNNSKTEQNEMRLQAEKFNWDQTAEKTWKLLLSL